jgi:hypothetical protein
MFAGHEILQRRELDTAHLPLSPSGEAPSVASQVNGGGGGGAAPVHHLALTEDQFRSIGGRAEDLLAMQGDLDRMEQQQFLDILAARRRGAGHEAGGMPSSSGGYVAPAWYDWTPWAIRRRVSHALEEQYKAVGRLVVKTILAGTLVYCGVLLIRRGLGVDDVSRRLPPPPAARGGGHRGGRASRLGTSTADDDSRGGVVGSVVRGIFSVGPKQLLDFVLAPAATPSQASGR